MWLADRLCMLAARTQGLITDFLLIFFVRLIMKWLGVNYLRLDMLLPEDWVAMDDLSTGVMIIYWSMYFVSGLPQVIFAGIWMVYGLACLTIYGQTVGMWTVGVKLVDRNGNKPGFLRVLLRQVISPFSSVLWLGYLVAWVTPRAETLHDFIAGLHPEYTRRKTLTPEQPSGSD